MSAPFPSADLAKAIGKTSLSPEVQRAFAEYRAALSVANAPTPALAIVQREVIDTAIKVRDARALHLPTVEHVKRVQLVALLRVRRQLRELVA